MDFFAAQDRARRRTLLLLVPAFLALVVIIFLAYFLALGCWWLFTHHRDGREAVHLMEAWTGENLTSFGWWHPLLFWVTAVCTTLLIAGGSIWRIVELGRQGGNFIAHRIGAKMVRYDTTDFEERRLINIVEELAIASGVRIPELFILEEDGINSFCAGHNVDSAVLIITRGAVDILDRDELQAVLAHEFSHILNADMVINTRMVGVLHGLMMFTVTGRSLLLGGSAPFIIGGGALVALGCVGNVLGTAIQSLICRQREWLADAHAIQFTRNPGAVGSALKKIGGYYHHSHVPRPFAIESAHMFFANAIEKRRIIRTHPSLTSRIRAITPGFDGVFPRVANKRKATAQTIARVEKFYRERMRESVARDRKNVTTAALAAAIGDALLPAQRGVSTDANLRWGELAKPSEVVARITAGPGNPLFAATLIENIGQPLREAAHDPVRARLLLFALLFDETNPAVRAKQSEIISRAIAPEESVIFENVRRMTKHLRHALHLPLADMALPVLKTLSPGQIDALVKTFTELIAADGKVSLFEYALRQVAIRQLRPPAAPTRVEMQAGRMAGSISVLLSAMAHAGAVGADEALSPFNEGKKLFPLPVRNRMQLAAESALAPGVLTMALSHVERAAPLIKKDILAALAQAASHDGVIKPGEQEVLLAVAAALNCPAPMLAA